ncbi:MAG: hypothetical protein KF715_09220 [Candidatus Didemnitutus sp.]|nr:hypothetical protein [Candidatus Didemnitutus sp.]
MPDQPDPPRKNYGFKPKEFERVNAPRSEAGEPHDTPPPANDVFAIQRELREREIAAGLDELAPSHRPNWRRRKRDYWVTMILLNGVGLPLAIWGYRTQNAVLFVYCLAGLVIADLALTWIMWVLLDDY